MSRQGALDAALRIAADRRRNGMADLRSADRYLSQLKGVFSVTLNDARAIISHFHGDMRDGLAGEESSLKMLPAFVGRPQGTEEGQFLAVDLGGTAFRVLAVALDGKGHAAVTAAGRSVIPPELMHGGGGRLFDFIAQGIQAFFSEHKLSRKQAYPLAFTFSFPMAQTAVDSGTLIEWTKGFTASGVVGRDVAGLLAKALKRRELGFIRTVALANDTVGTLMAGSYADPSCDLGVILGTGTNACYPEKGARIGRRPELADCGEMIVNLEWGNFNKLKMNVYDMRLDCASGNAGRQQLEKMVSGMYLGEIARRVIERMTGRGLLFGGEDQDIFDEEYALTAEHLSLLAGGADIFTGLGLPDVSAKDKRAIGEIGRIVVTRSARIAAAAIAAVVTWMDARLEADHTVAVDGSLFEKYPGYGEAMTALLQDLFGDRAARIKLNLVKDGSGIGAAIIGAVAASARC
jgi:hexokinase